VNGRFSGLIFDQAELSLISTLVVFVDQQIGAMCGSNACNRIKELP